MPHPISSTKSRRLTPRADHEEASSGNSYRRLLFFRGGWLRGRHSLLLSSFFSLSFSLFLLLSISAYLDVQLLFATWPLSLLPLCLVCSWSSLLLPSFLSALQPARLLAMPQLLPVFWADVTWHTRPMCMGSGFGVSWNYGRQAPRRGANYMHACRSVPRAHPRLYAREDAAFSTTIRGNR